MHVISQENATWQGQVTWLNEKETRSFRSLLELIKLIDGAMDDREMPDEAVRVECGVQNEIQG